ncbi:MAG: hypothetical protein AAF611_22220 [Bacteroidota bacterium]
MKLALQHTDYSLYPHCGIFIKHASPKVWLQEITRMQLKLSDCSMYPCPALEANSISGVIIIFKSELPKLDIRNHVGVQKVHTDFYIPENTRLNMSLTQEEYAKLLQGNPHFFHHEYGLMELKEQVHWETLLQTPKEQFPNLETPAKGVHIPMKVTAFSVEVEEQETENALQNPLGDEKVDTKELPFEMKKVLEGNNREVEKYLKYLEKNPDAALKMAVPLDMLGTSRGKAFAKYRFKTNFFDAVGFNNASESTKTSIKTVLGILAVIAIFWLGSIVVDAVKKNQVEVVPGTSKISESGEEGSGEEELVVESTEMDSESLPDTSRMRDKSQSDYNVNDKEDKASRKAIEVFLLFLIVFGGFIFIGYLIANRKKKRPKVHAANTASSSWMNLPEESELFTFDDEPEKRNTFSFYFGGDELSVRSKVLLICILIAATGYLLYPMFTDNGTKTIFIIIAIGIVIRLLYFLFNKNKALKDD